MYTYLQMVFAGDSRRVQQWAMNLEGFDSTKIIYTNIYSNVWYTVSARE